eukprot:Rmarinus@m.14253
MEKYRIDRVLGKGSYGKVFLVKHKLNGGGFVLKRIGLDGLCKKEREAVFQETKLLAEMQHPYVCGHVEHWHDEDELCIIMEYCPGGDLFKCIKAPSWKKKTEEQILSLFVQLCLALRYVHRRRTLHRDIKTQNIFLAADNKIKLGDFGIAKILDGTVAMAKTAVGTPYYMSPELIDRKPYSFKSDVWALGCVLYEMLVGTVPFTAQDMTSLMMKIVRGRYSPVSSTYSKNVRELVSDMLAPNPRDRPTVAEVLSRPFLRPIVEGALREEEKVLNNDENSHPRGIAGKDFSDERLQAERALERTRQNTQKLELKLQRLQMEREWAKKEGVRPPTSENESPHVQHGRGGRAGSDDDARSSPKSGRPVPGPKRPLSASPYGHGQNAITPRGGPSWIQGAYGSPAPLSARSPRPDDNRDILRPHVGRHDQGVADLSRQRANKGVLDLVARGAATPGAGRKPSLWRPPIPSVAGKRSDDHSQCGDPVLDRRTPSAVRQAWGPNGNDPVSGVGDFQVRRSRDDRDEQPVITRAAGYVQSQDNTPAPRPRDGGFFWILPK